jgi:uncharacterized protein YjeT (DUF2065 family)
LDWAPQVGIQYLKSVVSPAAEFEFTLLIVEGEPRNVNLAGTFENSRRKITAATVVPNHHIRLIGAVEFLIGTAIMKMN